MRFAHLWAAQLCYTRPMSLPINFTGPRIAHARATAEPPIPLEELSRRLLEIGVKLTPKEIAAIEQQERPVYDSELLAIMQVLWIEAKEVFENQED